jgi:lysyl-tRNA synthetase, class II
MAEYNSLEKIRLQKLEELRAEGVEAYPTRAKRTHTSAQAIAEFEADETKEVKATLAGRIRSMRPKGKLTFAHIEDGDGKVQLFFRVNEVGAERLGIFQSDVRPRRFHRSDGRDVPHQGGGGFASRP